MPNGWWRVFENHNAVSLTPVWDWLLQSTRPFPCIHNMFFHSFAMNCMQFLLCIYSFSGQHLPSGNQGRGKKSFHLQTRPSIFIQINPSYMPIHSPNGCLSMVRRHPPCHTTASLGVAIGVTVRSCNLAPWCVSFSKVLLIYVFNLSFRKERC